MKNQTQLTIDNLPPEHPVYLKAREFVKMKRDLEGLKNELEAVQENVVEIMRSERKKSIVVDGTRVSLKEIDAKTSLMIK